MKRYIFIKADTNDADYISTFESITDEQLEVIRPMIQAIKDFKPYKSTYKNKWEPDKEYERIHAHNFSNGECYREDLGEKSIEELYGSVPGFHQFLDMVPYGEYGIHTIESIKIVEVIEDLI